jgi:hypothetical protein
MTELNQEALSALIAEVDELPNPQRSMLTGNERALIDFCQRLAVPLRAALASSDAAPESKPGWVLVPREPTEAMLRQMALVFDTGLSLHDYEGSERLNRTLRLMRTLYQEAMLDAAPESKEGE